MVRCGHYLADHGELPDTPLLANVPVSVREESRRSEGHEQGVGSVRAPGHRRRGDPWERLTQMEANRNARDNQSHSGRCPAGLG